VLVWAIVFAVQAQINLSLKFGRNCNRHLISGGFNPDNAFDHQLLPKSPVKLGVNSVSLTQHIGTICLARETANLFGILALLTKFKLIIRVLSYT